MSKIVLKLAKIIDTLNERIGKLICLLFVPVVLISVTEVVLRHFFNAPTIWAWELNIQLFVILVMLSGGYTLLKNHHVAVDVITNMLPEKGRLILKVIMSLFTIVALSVIIKYGFDLFLNSFAAREIQPTIWGSPMYTIRFMIPFGSLLLLLQVVSESAKTLLVLFNNHNVSKGGITE